MAVRKMLQSRSGSEWHISKDYIIRNVESGGGKERNFVSVDDEEDHKKWQQIVMILENKKS